MSLDRFSAQAAAYARFRIDYPVALYAWLLRIGGQGGQSERVLAEARAHTPDAPVTTATEAALSTA